MDIIIIIGAVFVASTAGYLIRLAVEKMNNEQIIVTRKNPLKMIPSYIKYLFVAALFLFIMSILILITHFEKPF